MAYLDNIAVFVRVVELGKSDGLAREVEFAARRDVYSVVPAMDNGRLRLVA